MLKGGVIMDVTNAEQGHHRRKSRCSRPSWPSNAWPAQIGAKAVWMAAAEKDFAEIMAAVSIP